MTLLQEITTREREKVDVIIIAGSGFWPLRHRAHGGAPASLRW